MKIIKIDKPLPDNLRRIINELQKFFEDVKVGNTLKLILQNSKE